MIAAPLSIVISGAVTRTEPASPLANGPADALILVPAPLSDRIPCAVTVTVPPFPVPLVAELTWAPFDRDSAPPADRVTLPAFPVLPICAAVPTTDGPSTVSSPATVAMTSPPLPDPEVPLNICPPVSIVSACDAIATFPAMPVLPVSAALWIRPPLSMLSVPALRLTVPAFPVLPAAVEMTALLDTLIVSAAMVTLPSG